MATIAQLEKSRAQRVKDISELPASLTAEEAWRALGVGKNTFYAAVKRGEIKVARIGARLIVPRAEIERILSAGGE